MSCVYLCLCARCEFSLCSFSPLSLTRLLARSILLFCCCCCCTFALSPPLLLPSANSKHPLHARTNRLSFFSFPWSLPYASLRRYRYPLSGRLPPRVYARMSDVFVCWRMIAVRTLCIMFLVGRRCCGTHTAPYPSFSLLLSPKKRLSVLSFFFMSVCVCGCVGVWMWVPCAFGLSYTGTLSLFLSLSPPLSFCPPPPPGVFLGLSLSCCVYFVVYMPVCMCLHGVTPPRPSPS